MTDHQNYSIKWGKPSKNHLENFNGVGGSAALEQNFWNISSSYFRADDRTKKKGEETKGYVIGLKSFEVRKQHKQCAFTLYIWPFKNHTYLEMNCDFVSLEEINNTAGEEREMNCEGEANCVWSIGQ